MVHRREIDGEVLAFGNQGDLYLNAMTWFDHTTGSVWSQPFGEAILGPLTGAALELLPSTLTTWDAWRDSHPDTLALDTRSTRSGFALDLMTIVVEIGDEQRWAVFSRRLRDGVADLEVLDGELTDTISGTTFDPVRGLGRDGPLSDQSLGLLPGFTAFEWEFVNLFPDGRVWDGT